MLLLFSIHYKASLNKSSPEVLVLADSSASQWDIDKFFTNI